jgi:mRNA deadenylase 3'-5' endonuclease subunit Ccr4
MADADLVALQECDRSWMHKFWAPHMHHLGYELVGFTCKTGKTFEGYIMNIIIRTIMTCIIIIIIYE